MVEICFFPTSRYSTLQSPPETLRVQLHEHAGRALNPFCYCFLAPLSTASSNPFDLLSRETKQVLHKEAPPTAGRGEPSAVGLGSRHKQCSGYGSSSSSRQR